MAEADTYSTAIAGDGSELVAGDGSALILNIDPVPAAEWPFCAYEFSRPRIKRTVKDFFTKSPSEEFHISCDMGVVSGVFGPGEIVESGEITAIASDGSAASVFVPDSTAYDGGAKISVKGTGGSMAGSRYTISFRVLTSSGNRFSNDIEMVIL